jgi:hypothetical protein
VIINLHHFVTGVDFVQQKRQFRIVRYLPARVVDGRAVQIGLLVALLERNGVPQGRNAAHDGAVAERDEHVAVLTKAAQHLDVLFVAAAALNQADRAPSGELLDVINGRLVKIHQLGQLQNAIVDVQNGHVAAEAAGERGGGNFWLGHSSVPCEF